MNGSMASYGLALAVMIGLLILGIKVKASDAGSYMAVLTLWSLIITYHRTYDFWVMVIVVAFFIGKNRSTFIKWFYGIDILAVFFVLRIFSESTPSKLFVGVIYYLFAITATVCLIKDVKQQE